MKKFTIKLSDADVIALDQLFDKSLVVTPQLEEIMTNPERCAFAVLKKWHVNKLKPAAAFPTGGEHKFKMDAPVVYAWLSFFDRYSINPTNQLGNRVLQIIRDMLQLFSL